MKNKEQGSVAEGLIVTFGFLIVIGLIVLTLFGLIWGWNAIKVYSAEQSGRAKLAEARSSKQVQIEEAKGKLEAERLNAQSEVVRAKGAAEAITQERGSFTNEEYIRYLYVRDMEKLKTDRIYVPTEAGIPIIEPRK